MEHLESLGEMKKTSNSLIAVYAYGQKATNLGIDACASERTLSASQLRPLIAGIIAKVTKMHPCAC
jgi:hypothetical protein